MHPNSTTTTYGVLGSTQKGLIRRQAIFANAAAGITALITGGIIVPTHSAIYNSARRLIGVRGIASDAAHLDLDAKSAILRAAREAISNKFNSER